jgi:hypothetical protein
VNATSEYSQQGWCGVCLCGLGKGWLRGGVREEGGGGAHRWAEAQRRVPAVRRLYPVFTLYLSYLKPNPRDYVCMGTAFVLA